MKKIILLILVFISFNMYSQNTKQVDEILNEGKLLYRLEKGSWYGTDDFLTRFSDKKDSIGGYLSYENKESKINTIFYSRFNNSKILVRYTFDSLTQTKPIKVDVTNLKILDLEKDLIALRKDAQNRAAKNTDSFFSFYNNTVLNFIPVITEKERKVFVITGPQISGIVLLGNDYLLKYNNKNKLKTKEKIHNSIIQLPYTSEDKNKPTVATLHSHIVSEYINSTDICTLLLYKKYVDWKTHYILGKKYVSIFNLEEESLVIITLKAWNKMSNNN
ncbi:MAG: hypothetical protein QNK89_07890 [Lacinutrix sp.]|uniref:hypothetical protein n=1 Tax=Lacinutrix sp. TaxID=1937692 RepID=UPI0030A6F422